MDICNVNAFQSMFFISVFVLSHKEIHVLIGWNLVKCGVLMGGYSLLQQSSVIATFAQTSTVITVLLH